MVFRAFSLPALLTALDTAAAFSFILDAAGVTDPFPFMAEKASRGRKRALEKVSGICAIIAGSWLRLAAGAGTSCALTSTSTIACAVLAPSPATVGVK